MNQPAEFSFPEYPIKRPTLIGEELSDMDETIYVDNESGSHIAVNTVGSAILELCDGTHTAAQIASIIAESVDCDPDRVHKDTQHILQEFAAYGAFIE